MGKTRRTADLADQALRATSNPAYRFVIEVDGQTIGAFTECTLPAVEWEMLDVQEGGLNSFVHSLAGRRKKTTLSLKNGLGYSAGLMNWYLASMDEKPTPKPVTVKLLNTKQKPVMCWHLNNCRPVKWSAPRLAADANGVAIQTLELACGDITVES